MRCSISKNLGFKSLVLHISVWVSKTVDINSNLFKQLLESQSMFALTELDFQGDFVGSTGKFFPPTKKKMHCAYPQNQVDPIVKWLMCTSTFWEYTVYS